MIVKATNEDFLKAISAILAALITPVPHFNDKGHYPCQQTCRISLCGKRKALSLQVKPLSFSLSIKRTKDQRIKDERFLVWNTSQSVNLHSPGLHHLLCHITDDWHLFPILQWLTSDLHFKKKTVWQSTSDWSWMQWLCLF